MLNEALGTTIQGIGAFAAAAAALAWLTKAIVTRFLDKDVESYKAMLHIESEREIERLKAALQIASQQHHIQFSHLHSRRAEVIQELYTRILNAENALSTYDFETQVCGGGSSKHSEAAHSLREYYAKHRLFFERSLCTALEDLIASLMLPIGAAEYGGSFDGPRDPAEKTQRFQHMLAQVKEKIPAVKRTLEDEFRQLLGVKHHEAT